jgi:hypothetical protein
MVWTVNGLRETASRWGKLQEVNADSHAYTAKQQAMWAKMVADAESAFTLAQGIEV